MTISHNLMTTRNSQEPKLRLAVLASGRGSNFEAICQAVDEGRLHGQVVLLISDNENAQALERARKRGIKALYINPQSFASRIEYEKALVRACQEVEADIVALAGYMRLLGKTFLNEYHLKTVNIHPALLPAFPGLHAQKQALDYGVRFSGCTVHFVDEGVDTGPIILQAVVPVYFDDTVETLEARILKEEHRIYPKALQLIAEGRVVVEGRRVRIIGDEHGDQDTQP
ncbi:phosphoribosylglycinamide formyltransferase [Syntrophothermus lipocalidus]|uniref:Phosphoribosylglycinamide formyltransferase n=1 Tax=Syntrophothermus lipocalidus (strain DSM 12680 / TGB-C1) TaxID=643648 RepID=D7CL03_SYNLT|nr:phosphoribosylglycinamide formyltransferase [Syntrophothermus lipocalidus]ADI01388.1 phosphoribosylglycinamide formyltransferase [Syntrophothermus lipocalidus DSM 12680]